MKTKFFILALLASFVYAVEAQEFQPQIGYSNEAGYKTNFKKNKARDNWFISIAGGASVLLGDQNGEADFKNRLNPRNIGACCNSVGRDFIFDNICPNKSTG